MSPLFLATLSTLALLPVATHAKQPRSSRMSGSRQVAAPAPAPDALFVWQRLGDTARKPVDVLREPRPRRHFALIARGGGHATLFGGHTEQTVLDETWEYGTDGWIPMARAPDALRPSPPYDTVGAAAGDDKLLLFGGMGSGRSPLGDTWLWDGSAWKQLPTPSHPSARECPALAPIGDGYILLFGGQSGDGKKLDDTWVWDGSSWSEYRSNPVHPSARSGHTLVGFNDPRLAFDNLKHDSYGCRTAALYGGELQNGAKSNELWQWLDGRWIDLTSAVATDKPMPMAFHGMVWLGAAPPRNEREIPRRLGEGLLFDGAKLWSYGRSRDGLPMQPKDK